MARAAKKETLLTPEEKLAQALVPEEEQPFKLPDNWLWIPIGSINQYNSGNIEPAKQPESIFELYSVPSSVEGYPEIVSGQEIGSTKQKVEKGDVLLCKINPRINRVWKVSQHTENTLLASSEWIVIRNSLVNPDYLMYCFRSPFFREYMLSNVSGVGGSLMRAQPKHVQDYPVPIPPLAEQQRIVDRIESLFAKLDEAKEKAQAVVDSFEDRKAAILHKAFTGELTAEWKKRNGAPDWKQVNLGSCLNTMETRKPTGEFFFYIDIDSIDNKRQIVRAPKKTLVKEAPSRASRAVHCGDVLFSMVRPYLKNIALIDEGLQDCIASTGFYVCSPKSNLDSKYLYHLLCSKDAIDYLMQYMKGDNSPSIRRDDLLNMEIMLPSLREQKQIEAILHTILEKEQQANETAMAVIDQIDAMKRSIFARAFCGELGTNDPADESAEELLKRVL